MLLSSTSDETNIEYVTLLLVLNLLSLGSGWLAGVGEDEAGLTSSAGETLEGLVEANSNTNCSMSARGYLVGPEP